MTRLQYKLIVAFSLIGLSIATYLAYFYIYGAPIPCSNHGCDTVRQSSYAKVYGIPMPLFGVVFYLLFALLGVLKLLKKTFPYDDTFLRILGTGGLLFSAYLTYLEAYVILAWCVWCVASAIVSTFICITTIIPLRQKK
jgi:uncharacterized membrane protein